MPKIRFRKYTRGGYMFITEPLFRSYIFACFDNGKYSHMISYTHGVQYIAGKENPRCCPH